ncbi:MAG: GNAT family N-acetyltransferase [Planctomycetota bacterium]
MPKTGDIHVHWLSLTDRGPVRARLDEQGDIDPQELQGGTCVVAAMQNGKTLVMAGVVADDQKISVTIPDISIASARPSRRIADDPWRLIIRAIRECATKLNMQRLELMLPDENAPGLEPLCRSLQRSGLKRRARFAVWQFASDSAILAKPATGHSIRSITARDLTRNSDGRRQCLELLIPILASSSDLRQLPNPLPDVLLDDWDESDGILFLESDAENQYIGVCCCVLSDSRNSTTGHGLEIRFIGVLPSRRNQGCGCRMLAAAASFARSLPSTSAMVAPSQLSVCVDADNQPAVRLYQRAGFSLQRPFQLWLDAKLNQDSGWGFPDKS